jgi:hypothetical protein
MLWLTNKDTSAIIYVYAKKLGIYRSKASRQQTFILNLERQHKMATEKLFTVAGTATNADGTVKARFANDLVARIKILNKAGCTDINLVELPKAMTKLEALQYLQETQSPTGDAGYAVANKLAEKTKIAKRDQVKIAGKATAKVADEA